MLNQDKIKLLKLLEEIGDVIIIDTTEKAFIQYFSTFDIHGVSNLLSDVHKFDSYSKTKYLEFINSFFQDLKDKGIENLSIYKGKCTNCLKGQGAISFTDKKSGLFIDLVLKIKDDEIIDITECYSVKNYSFFNKKQQLKITPGTDLRI